jgi:hypothetical protein
VVPLFHLARKPLKPLINSQSSRVLGETINPKS